MNIQTLRFKAISHLPQGQLIQYLATITSTPPQTQPQTRNSTTTGDKDSQSREQTFGSTPQPTPTRNTIQRPRRDSIIKSFVSSERNEDMSKLKQQCTKLRFQKIALESSMQKLREQLVRKDQVIQRLSGQVQGASGGPNGFVPAGSHVMHHNLQNIQGLRHTITPIY